MKFKDFAQLMRPIVGGASSTHAFVKTLFDAIVTDEGSSALEEIGESSYKAYYNGESGISRLAKKISPYIEPEEFISYFDDFSDAAVESLCDSFLPYLPDINPHNAGELLAGLFRDIIKKAAETKRKSTPKGADIGAEVVDDEMPSGAATEEPKMTVIHQQTNVIQNGDNNVNVTNNGTMNFNF